MNYVDKHGRQVAAGMSLLFEDGSVEMVYDTVDAFGNPDLGINASNEAYLKAHGLGEFDREFYSLSNFSASAFEIIDPQVD